MGSAYLYLTLMALFFGGTWVAGKVGVDAIPPVTLAAGRFAIASLLLWLWAKTKQPSGRPPRLGDLPLILGMGLTAIAGYNMLFLYGLKLVLAQHLANVEQRLLQRPPVDIRQASRLRCGLALPASLHRGSLLLAHVFLSWSPTLWQEPSPPTLQAEHSLSQSFAKFHPFHPRRQVI